MNAQSEAGEIQLRPVQKINIQRHLQSAGGCLDALFMSYEPVPLRYTLDQAARIVGLTRSVLYLRINAGEIAVHKDGRRVFVTATELDRYVTTKAGAA
jgi:excisionase family DNA binding protein